MKLTLTRVLGSARVSSGFGVAKGSGGSEASQSLLEAGCGMAANLESRNADAHIWLSRAPSVTDVGDAKTRNSSLLVDARQLTEAKTTRRNESNLQTGITNFQLLRRNPHASRNFPYIIDKTVHSYREEVDRSRRDENHCSIESGRRFPLMGSRNPRHFISRLDRDLHYESE